ncbi:hypothetical protein [Mycobacteroides abscessus]|uniref:hypothetical protein n=1 Tax=Mycobacteroides abscessus TaxID=36809 RepID=UPI0009426AA6|nr:hypothetical protein [Mycobacteroides abscessus]
MKIRLIGAAVGIAAVLAALPVAMLGGEPGTGGAVPIAQADPTTLHPGDPDYERQKRIQDEWERGMDDFNRSHTPQTYSPTRTVTVMPTTTPTRPATTKSNKDSGGGIPWWGWVLLVVGALLAWAFVMAVKDTSQEMRDYTSARSDDDDDDDEDDGDTVLQETGLTASGDQVTGPRRRGFLSGLGDGASLPHTNN